jgi:hypothetical protein
MENGHGERTWRIITYSGKNRKQYVVIDSNDAVMAFALP